MYESTNPMPFVTTRLPNEPIILVQVDLAEISQGASLRSIKAEIDQMASERAAPLYVLIDLRRQEILYSDILLMLDYSQQHTTGTLSDPRLRIALVGEHPLLGIAIRKFNLAFDNNIHHLASMEDAITWARQQANESNHNSTP